MENNITENKEFLIELRRKVLEDNYEPSTEEIKKALEQLRQQRVITPSTKKKSPKVEEIDLSSLL